jgi:hypothetical protein
MPVEVICSSSTSVGSRRDWTSAVVRRQYLHTDRCIVQSQIYSTSSLVHQPRLVKADPIDLPDTLCFYRLETAAGCQFRSRDMGIDSPSICAFAFRSRWDPDRRSSECQCSGVQIIHRTCRLFIQPHCKGELVRHGRCQYMCGIVPKKEMHNTFAADVSAVVDATGKRTGTISRLP